MNLLINILSYGKIGELKLNKMGYVTYPQLGNYGRFGNQLFQIASTIGFAIQQGHEYGFPDWYYQRFFVNELPKISKPVTLRTSGYLQSFYNFDHCEDIIRHYFTMKPFDLVLKNTIFIHFRAYSKERVTHLHPEQTSKYYEDAIKLFPGKDFIVFTDNILRAKSVIDLDCPFVCGPEMEDFYLMTQCDGGIISNSTYSWWAAWLGKGEVVAPRNWFGGYYITKYGTEGYYLKDWIVL